MIKSTTYLILMTIISHVIGAAVLNSVQNDKEIEVSPEFAVIQKVYDDCQDTNDFVKCLKGKAVTALSRAIEQESIQLFDGVALVKQNQTEVEDIPGLTDARTLSGISGIDKELVQKLGHLLKTHFVRFEMSESRGKKKGGATKYIVAALLTAMSIAGPLGLKALAAIAGKALVISKVALTIASIIALKKIFSSDHPEETSFQVHAGDHNRRNAYVIRPGKSAPASIDPYKYYYDQQYSTTA